MPANVSIAVWLEVVTTWSQVCLLYRGSYLDKLDIQISENIGASARAKMHSKSVNIILVALVFLGVSVGPAHAYLDPGTGSILLQLLLGGFAGLAIIFKLYYQNIRETLKRWLKRLHPAR